MLSASGAGKPSVAALKVHRQATHVSPNVPKATLVSARGVDDAGAVSMTLRVRYTDKHGIDLTSLGLDDISLSDGLVINSATPVASGKKSAVVTYVATGVDDPSIAIKGKATYSVLVNADSVFNTIGLAVTSHALATVQMKLDPGSIGTPVPPVVTAPVAQMISAPDVSTTGVASVDIQVQFADAQGIDYSTIVPSNITLVAGETLTPSSVTTASADGGKTVIATYTVAAPSGVFTALDDGAYALNLNDAAPVQNIAGLPATSSATPLGTLHVAVAASIPTAIPGDAIDVTTFGVRTVAVTVTYHDDIAIDTSTIATANLSFATTKTLPIVGVSQVSSDNGKTVVATYTLVAPDGVSFKSPDNGDYEIVLGPNSVFNTTGQAVAATTSGWQTLTINVPDTSTATPPTASVVSSPYLSDAGVSQIQIQIAYTDAMGIDTSSIVAGNLIINGDNLTASRVDIVASSDGRTVLATYIIPPPNGDATFVSADNGTYEFALSTDAPVKNIAGLSVDGQPSGVPIFHIVVPLPTDGSPTV